jgi:hypothetical protein
MEGMMKFIDRQGVEGTVPVIYIGHREYRKKDGRRYVSRTWYAEWCIRGQHHHQALKTSNKNTAIRKAHDFCRRIENGEPKPKVYKLSIEELAKQYLEVKKNEGRSTKTLEKYTFGMNTFAEWANSCVNISAVGFSPRLFWSFIQTLRDQKKSDVTIYDRAILIKQAFKWAAMEKLIPENLLAGLRIEEPAPNEQPCFTPAQVAVLLVAADPHEPSSQPWRTWDCDLGKCGTYDGQTSCGIRAPLDSLSSDAADRVEARRKTRKSGGFR